MSWSIEFIPFVSWPVLCALAGVGVVLFGLLLWRARRGAVLRESLATTGRPVFPRLRFQDPHQPHRRLAVRSVHVENSTGSYIDLSPEGALIHAAGGMTLRAPGKRIAIEGDRIDFRRL